MSFQPTIDNLSQKYNIVDCIDLSDFDINRNKLFSRLSKFKNYEFLPNERLILIADKSLTCTFDDLGPDIFIDLQQHIHYYNIPHYFIIMVSNIDNLADYLLHLQQVYYRQETDQINYIYV